MFDHVIILRISLILTILRALSHHYTYWNLIHKMDAVEFAK
jgi:hypothetical protein